jgi:hypothetical protein
MLHEANDSQKLDQILNAIEFTAERSELKELKSVVSEIQRQARVIGRLVGAVIDMMLGAFGIGSYFVLRWLLSGFISNDVLNFVRGFLMLAVFIGLIFISNSIHRHANRAS